jgi:glycosyltransferase involved in cell wall biosynthesis
MKIAFIHNSKKIGTGAHYINDLVSIKLTGQGHKVENFYPKTRLLDSPNHLKGLENILFFYSLLLKKSEILKYDLVHGTTYTPLPFLAFNIPVVAHFGSTTSGFLKKTPRATDIEDISKKYWYELKKANIIKTLNSPTRRPLRDIAEIEHYVAARATAIIASSQAVKEELLLSGIPPEKIHVIHNAIEDYWFEKEITPIVQQPHLVFLGRLGEDPFTLKLKGLDRCIQSFRKFADVPKDIFCITAHKQLLAWLNTSLPNTQIHANIIKDQLPQRLAQLSGSVLFVSSRYEGFSLSLIEGMSQGLIPVVYPVGVASEIIRDGENGYIVHSQHEANARIAELLSLSSKERDTLAAAARETAGHFTSDLMISELEKLYGVVIKAKSKNGD